MNDNRDLLEEHSIPFKERFIRTSYYVKPEFKSFILALLLIFANVGFDIVIPLFVGWVTDNLNSPNIALNVIIGLSIGTLLITVINQIFLYIENLILTKAGQRIIFRLRLEVFDHIESLSQEQFNDMAVGSLVTRVCNYTSSMSEFFTNTLVKIVKNILTVLGVYIIMMTLSWKLGLLLFGVVVIVFIISYFFSKYVHKIFTKERNLLSDLNTFLNESLSGMKITQIFNQESKALNKFDTKNEDYRRIRYKITFAFGIYRPLISFIYICSVALTLYFGVTWQLLVGEIVSFYFYLSKFFNPIQELADELNHIQRFNTNSERIFNLLDIVPDVLDLPEAKRINNFKGKIEFKHVWFAYEKEDWILKDVSFVIDAKSTVAFVGPTGCGKTTILNLIVRNYEINKGQILIDDIDIKDIKISSLRGAVGQMLQDVFLFSGNIKDNITLFDDEIEDNEITQACKYVNLEPIINTFPDKYNEKVIERGENFSTGQRQLLSFARTVVHKPQIMILDEATANIDTETEVVIQESLEKIKNIGTMLMVAHRLSTIQHADQIIVLSHGEIIEKGTHQDLLKHKGYYYKLYQLQFSQEK